MGRKEQPSGNWVWSLPKNHYSFPRNNSKNCLSSTCTYTIERKGPEEKCGQKFLHVKQKLLSFLFFNFIKEKKKTQQLFRLNLPILFYNQCPKRPIHSIFPFMSTYMKAGLSNCIHKALQERVCCLLNLAGCSYTAAEVGPLSPHSGRLKVISQRALCPDVKCLGILPPSVPTCLLLCQPMSCWSSSVPSWGTLASPAWNGLQARTLVWSISGIGISSFPLFIRLMHHPQKRWRLQIPLWASGSGHFQILPPLKKHKGQAQDIIFSLSCGCQDLKPLSCSFHIHCSCILLSAWIWQGHILLFQSHPLLPVQWKKHSRSLLQHRFPCDLDRVTVPQLFTRGLTSIDPWKYKPQFPGMDKLPNMGIRIKDG